MCETGALNEFHYGTFSVPDPGLAIRRGPVIQTLRKVGGGGGGGCRGGLPNIFSAPRASVCSKNKGDAGPPGPSPGSATAFLWLGVGGDLVKANREEKRDVTLPW